MAQDGRGQRIARIKAGFFQILQDVVESGEADADLFGSSSRVLKGPCSSRYLTMALATRALMPETCLSRAAEAELTSTPAKLTQETTTRSSMFASSFWSTSCW